MPLHWIYDVDQIKRMAANTPEFYDPPSCPYYTYPLGSFSLYGQVGDGAIEFGVEC